MRSIFSHTPALIVASAVMLAAAPAAARSEQVSVTVTTSDLNLTTAAGQRALDGRINRAARQVCATGSRSLSAITAENACIAAARAGAFEQVPGVVTIAAIGERRARG